MSSINYVVNQLQEMGLDAEAKGDTVFCEDLDLDFERSHDGVRGISRWLNETREEYEMAIADLLKDSPEEEEGAVTDAQIEEAQDEAEEFAPAPPEKGHVVDSAQLELARELNSPKEIAQANDDQDRGGIPNPEDYIAVVLVKGQRFVAPEGWKIRESRPSGKVVWYGSIYQTRKTENEARGAEFALVHV